MAEYSNKSAVLSAPISTSTTGLTASTSATTKNPSCIVCRKRKIKCDRNHPCSNCIKSNAECVFRDSIPARHHKRRAEFALLSRLRHYENLLRKHGIDPEIDYHSGAKASADTATPVLEVQPNIQVSTVSDSEKRLHLPVRNRELKNPPNGQFLSKGGKSLYLENEVWNTLGSELDESDCIPDDSDAESGEHLSPKHEFDAESQNIEYHILFASPSNDSLTSLHPEPIHIFKLWQFFQDNVNPFTKIIHGPLVQQQILSVVGDLSSIGKSLEALLFSIYSCALLSLTDEEVQKEFGQEKSLMQARFRTGIQQALANAGVTRTSDLVLLQAFCLFIVSCRATSDRRTTWCLSSVAMRIAQAMGLHRDGSQLGLSVFETEMRRRVWWHIIYMDRTIARMSGFVPAPLPLNDTQMPLTVNDGDLHPSMKESPVERDYIGTDMIWCQLRQELGKWQDRNHNFVGSIYSGNTTTRSNLNNTDEAAVERDAREKFRTRQQAVNELEQVLEQKIVRLCDPSIPLHIVVKHSARLIISTMTLVAHHPYHIYRHNLHSPILSPAERDRLFSSCLELIEENELLRNSDSLKQFSWHLDWHFPWPTLLYMFAEMPQRSITSEYTRRGWDYIDNLFMPQFQRLGAGARGPLHIVCLKLAAKAWNIHLRECQELGIPAPPRPKIMGILSNYTSISRSRKGSPARYEDGSIRPSSATSSSQQESGQRQQQQQHQHNRPIADQILPQHETSFIGGEAGTHQTYSSVDNLQLQDFFGENQNVSSLNDGLPMNWVDWDPIFQYIPQSFGTSSFEQRSSN